MTPVDCFETKASFVENETFEFRIFADASLLFDFLQFSWLSSFPFFNQVNFAFEKLRSFLLMHNMKKAGQQMAFSFSVSVFSGYVSEILAF